MLSDTQSISDISDNVIEQNDSTQLNSEKIKLLFPHAISLSYSYYEDEKYNYLRRCKLILFGECLGNIVENDNIKINDGISQIKKKYVKAYLNSFGLESNTVKLVKRYLFPKIYTKEFIIKNLERGCLNRTLQKAKTHNIRCVWPNTKFVNLYHSVCYKVASNLDIKSVVNSTYIKDKILTQSLKVSEVANMSSKELCPVKYEKIDRKISKRTNLERKIKFSELYRCRKCKRNQCTTERRYNRSLDEGVNLMIHCGFCGHSWCG